MSKQAQKDIDPCWIRQQGKELYGSPCQYGSATELHASLRSGERFIQRHQWVDRNGYFIINNERADQ